jgi:ER degradation enhancer, mannosidase alpha-like 1
MILIIVCLVNFFTISLSNKYTTFDYTLYNQLNNDLNINNDDVNFLNYYNLNNETISDYSQYLYFSDAERQRLKQLSKEMFDYGYNNYLNHAFPMDELDPIHCQGRGPDSNIDNININDSLGDYLLTLVDSLSTLVVMGNATEFQRASSIIFQYLNFDKDTNVQVFEATIRMLGGLLSAHLIAINKEQPFNILKIQNYDNQFLNLAQDLGDRLLVAFNKLDTKLPYPRVNLRNGLPNNSFSYTCTSGAGSLLLEFGMLSELLNDPVYERAARDAVEFIYSKKDNMTGLVGNQIDIHTGQWLSEMSGLGAGMDSFYEYLLKVSRSSLFYLDTGQIIFDY